MQMQIMILFGITVGVAVILVFLGVARSVESTPADRLEEYMSDQFAQGRSQMSRRSSGPGAAAGEFVQGFDKILSSLGPLDQLGQALRRGGVKLTVTEYLIIWLASAAGMVLLGYTISQSWLPAALVGLLGITGPYFFIRYREGGRIHTFNGQLGNILTQISGSMRSGYGLLQAIEFASHEAPVPAGTEFAQVVRDVRLGRTLMAALDDLVDRVGSNDLELIVTCIHIQHETGGNLAEILDTVAETIRERVRIKGELHSLTAQQRYSGYVLALLPVVLFFILMLINPNYESRLFTPGPTLCIPIGAIVMMIIGFLIIRSIVSIEV